jgi:hypothetical protein
MEIEARMKPISSAELFNDSAHKPLLESWCTAIFGLGYARAVSPCRVALNTSATRGDIDFYLLVAGQQVGFQLTEVQEPGRRRGYEARVPGRTPRQSWLEEDLRGAAEGPGWIREGVQKKVKRYGTAGRDLNLLVYADFATDRMVAAAVAEELKPLRGAFNSVWVMDSVRIFSAYSPAPLGEVADWREARPISEYYE